MKTRSLSRPLSLLVAARMPLILLLLVTGSAFLTHGLFIQMDNVMNVLRQVSFEGLIAFGMTLVIITGGIDLSVGSLAAITGVAGALLIERTAGWPVWMSIGLGLAGGVAVGLLFGAASGAIIARFAIPPFIVTLAAMLIARGFAFILCDGRPVHELPEEFTRLGRGFVPLPILGRVPVTVVIMLAVFCLFWLLLNRTVFGRCVIAVGSNAEAAFLAGIPVRWTQMMVYVLTGGLCGLAGVLQAGKLGAGDPKSGEMWELNVIAAVVVGGTSLFGGRGTLAGTLIGALIIGVLNNSLNLLQVQHFWQKVVLGCVILAASLLDAGLRKLERE